jgi:hypothetical protein
MVGAIVMLLQVTFLGETYSHYSLKSFFCDKTLYEIFLIVQSILTLRTQISGFFHVGMTETPLYYSGLHPFPIYRDKTTSWFPINLSSGIGVM